MTIEAIDANSLPPALNPLYPLPGDPKKEGDDHLRNLKLVMQKFYAEYLSLTGNHESRIDVLEAYVGIGDSDTLGGQGPGYYTNAGNMATGILPVDRLTGLYNINISGNAATATLATTATLAVNATNAVLAGNSLQLGGVDADEILDKLPILYSKSLTGLAIAPSGVLATFAFTPAYAEEKWFVGHVSIVCNIDQPSGGDSSDAGAFMVRAVKTADNVDYEILRYNVTNVSEFEVGNRYDAEISGPATVNPGISISLATDALKRLQIDLIKAPVSMRVPAGATSMQVLVDGTALPGTVSEIYLKGRLI